MTTHPDAPLIEAMALIQRIFPAVTRGCHGLDDTEAATFLHDLRAAGYALVPVGLLEEAAEYLDGVTDTYEFEGGTETFRSEEAQALAARLRSEAGKGGGA